jgi:hypothetical protein
VVIVKKLGLLLLFACGIAHAAIMEISAVPTDWKVESYGATSVVLWFTSSPCENGLLKLPATATAAENNRLYATVMTAKLTKSPMFVRYEPSQECTIASFGMYN